ncbi:MAG: BtpA/SgcQ family protein [Phycisphaerales bacterium]|nr:BtpA/SgcQ family protein [Phycisphaerales bacterium]
MSLTSSIFGRDKALIGMIHVSALPGTTRHSMPMPKIVDQAADEAKLLMDCGFDAIIIENMHDAPYLRRDVGPEITAAMTMIGCAVREQMSERPLGVQILAGANCAALAVAHACGGEFIRAEGFVFASIADEGLLDSADAGPLLRYRKLIGADGANGDPPVKVLADIKKKHSSHAITADLDIGESAKAAQFFGADGVIVTGIATGQAIKVNDLGSARVATTLPLIVGSGVTPDSVKDLFAYADALIVGSWYKRDGLWSNPPDKKRASELIKAVNAAR